MRDDVLGPAQVRHQYVPPLNAVLWWTFNDDDGLILRFYDSDDLVAERCFPDINEAKEFFLKLLKLKVEYGPPPAKPSEDVAYYWEDKSCWMVQVGTSVADALGTDDVDRAEAAQSAAETAAAAGA
jgi:hypothetical protein